MAESPATSTSPSDAGLDAPTTRPLRRIGVVIHPSRSVENPLRLLREWTEEHGVDVRQMPAAYSQRYVAEQGDPSESDLVVSIGGDGTTLAALRTGAAAHRPVMGVACGSLGALATVSVAEVTASLDRFARGEWQPRRFPALSIAREQGEPLFALNDVSVVRAGGGQVRVTATLDGTLYARAAGDGAVISTPLGSSGYAISAGGPLLAPGVDGFVFTPLPKHGGFCPPLMAGPKSVLEVEVEAGFGGARLEIDGQVVDEHVRSLAVSLREDVATMVSFSDQEALLTGLRRRGIILDSPRLVVDGDRADESCPPG
jgi:NAD+ kinase